MMSTDSPARDHPPRDFEVFPRTALAQSIGARFEEICRRFPEKTAVCTRNRSWTYRELDARGNSVAGILRDAGVAPAAPVGILFEHDAPGIAAILGILKAGNFYCALDPDLGEQNQSILRRLSPAALLCDRAHLQTAQELAEEVPVIEVEDPPLSEADYLPKVLPSALAYIFFTSGSTGQPKGVMDSHRNVLHNVLRYTNNLKITAADRLTLLQKLSFSGSVSSLFCALLNGATVYPFDLARESAAALADWLEEQEITIYHSVPSIFRLIASEGRRFPRLRILRLEGDQASIGDAVLFQKHFHAPCLLVNGLGATECGIVRQFFLGTASPLPYASLPIGYPVEDVEVAVLDEGGCPLPPGEVGEIAVKSPYLAIGYWQEPDRTSRVFSRVPGDPEARTYQTGDLGRMAEDGCLEYLGRKDFDEKIRGRRVDLPAIEAETMRIAGVREAVAMIRPDVAGENQIVVYYTEHTGEVVSASEIGAHLLSCLGTKSMPAALMKLDRLPLNANGKIDRRALPAPPRQRMIAQPPLAPTTERELALIDMWKEILDLNEIGIDDSFVELGGDSLTAMRMLNRLRQDYGRDISILQFFENPTVSALASALWKEG